MKIVLLLIFLLHTLLARENPFEPIFCAPTVKDDIIPLLHITTNKVFAPPTQMPAPTKHIVTRQIELNVTQITKTKPATLALAPTIKTKQKTVKTKAKKPSIKKRKYKTIYQNYFLKVQTNYKNFKIFTKDRLLKKVRYTHPERMTFDFDRLQYFHTKNITFNKAFATKIKFGSHHDFYRITLQLGKYKQYKLTKKPYGYLLTFH